MSERLTVVFTVDGRSNIDRLKTVLKNATYTSESVTLVADFGETFEVFVHHVTLGDTA